MTAYATQEQCEFYAGGPDELIQLVNNNTGDTVVDATKLALAIESAGVTVDQYIGKQVAVPLLSPPLSIQHVTARLAVYALRASRRKVDKETHGKVYEDDMQMLKDIRDCVITLGIDPGPPAPSTRVDSVLKPSPWKQRSRESLKGFG